MIENIALEAAQRLVLEHVQALPAETAPLAEAGYRLLAADITAPADLPLRAQSAVDGYALGVGTAAAGTGFELVGRVAPGLVPAHAVRGLQAMGVTTGGLLPAGAEAVVPHERARREEGRLIIEEHAKPGQNIKAAGEDYRQGEMILSAGQLVDGGAVALLAALGIKEVPVVRRPRVTLLSLAENLVSYEQEPSPAQVRDSNLPMLKAYAQRLGARIAHALLLPPARLAAAQEELRSAWQDSDIMISSGLNYAPGRNELDELKAALGVADVFGEVDYMPGSHVSMAVGDGKMLLSLSGNPAACAVGFHLLAAPAIAALKGQAYRYEPIPMRLTNGFNKKSGSRRFARAYAECGAQGWRATVTEGQKPSMLRSLLGCNALLDIPAGTPGLAAGDVAAVYLLP